MVTSVLICMLCGSGVAGETVDLADPKHRDLWLSHPVIGEASYDAFVRFAQNPIYVGAPPYEWPVNGTLLRDPKSGHLYCYVSLYPKGYWPAGPTRLLRQRSAGGEWEDLGVVLAGDKDLFDGDGQKAGATCDASVVADEDGYHMAYGWAKPDNSNGGIAYAFAESPEGPWQRDPEPIHAESAQPLLPPGYKRAYASALIRRKTDWVILASMSTPGNAGGMWAFIGMAAPAARGPYCAPIFLRAPQQGYWQPQPIEFFPAFVHEGFVYAPLTSVAANRGYQVMYRAPLEDAHRPGSWSVWQAGSLFHAEPNAWEAHGIWGQTFAGIVESSGVFQVMYPSRSRESVGSINLASRRWDEPFQRGFWVSAPDAPSLALVLRRFREFRLDAQFRATGDWQLVWNHNAPLGPDRSHASATVSPLTWRDMTTLAVRGDTWSVEKVSPVGAVTKLGSGAVLAQGDRYTVVLTQTERGVEVLLNDAQIFSGACAPTAAGAIGMVAAGGTCMQVGRFALDTLGTPGSWFLLPLEGLIGAGNRARDWTLVENGFRFKTGYVGAFEKARAKWSFRGRKMRLWAPRGPDFGEAEMFLDNKPVGEVGFHAEALEESGVLWESGDLPPGLHALMLVRTRGGLPVDCVEFFP